MGGEPDIERRQEPTGETPRGDKQEKKRPKKDDVKRALMAFLKRGREERKGEGKGDKRPPPTGFPEEDKREEDGDRRKPKGDRDGDRKGDRKDDAPTGEPDIERRQEPTGETPREREDGRQEKEDLAEIAKLVKQIMKRRQQA